MAGLKEHKGLLTDWLWKWPPTVETLMHEWSSGAVHTPELKVALASLMPNTIKEKEEEEQKFHLHFKNQVVFACEDYLPEL